MIKPECIEYKLLEWRKLPEFTFTVDTVKGSQISFVDTVKGSQMFSFAALQYNYHIMILTH